MDWFAHRDRNSKVFHLKASERRKKNRIEGLLNINHEWCTSTDDIMGIITDYFQIIFFSSSPSVSNLDKVFSFVSQWVMNDLNTTLMRPFMGEDIKRDLMDMQLCIQQRPHDLMVCLLCFFRSTGEFWE